MTRLSQIKRLDSKNLFENFSLAIDYYYSIYVDNFHIVQRYRDSSKVNIDQIFMEFLVEFTHFPAEEQELLVNQLIIRDKFKFIFLCKSFIQYVIDGRPKRKVSVEISTTLSILLARFCNIIFNEDNGLEFFDLAVETMSEIIEILMNNKIYNKICAKVLPLFDQIFADPESLNNTRIWTMRATLVIQSNYGLLPDWKDIQNESGIIPPLKKLTTFLFNYHILVSIVGHVKALDFLEYFNINNLQKYKPSMLLTQYEDFANDRLQSKEALVIYAYHDYNDGVNLYRDDIASRGLYDSNPIFFEIDSYESLLTLRDLLNEQFVLVDTIIFDFHGNGQRIYAKDEVLIHPDHIMDLIKKLPRSRPLNIIFSSCEAGISEKNAIRATLKKKRRELPYKLNIFAAQGENPLVNIYRSGLGIKVIFMES